MANYSAASSRIIFAPLRGVCPRRVNVRGPTWCVWAQAFGQSSPVARRMLDASWLSFARVPFSEVAGNPRRRGGVPRRRPLRVVSFSFFFRPLQYLASPCVYCLRGDHVCTSLRVLSLYAVTRCSTGHIPRCEGFAVDCNLRRRALVGACLGMQGVLSLLFRL